MENTSGKDFIQCTGNNDIKRVKKMLDAKPGRDVINYQNNGGNTPLMLATQLNTAENSINMVKLLLTAQPDIEMKNKFGLTALMVAAKRGYAIVVQALLDAGADFCATSESNERAIDLTKDYSTRTILQQLDDAKIAKERAAHILTTGAEFLALIGRRDVTAVSKLLAANIEHYPEIMEFEFDTMVSAGGVMRFNRPLGVAVMTHCAEMVDMLVKAGADVNAVHSESTDRFTPLMQNCMQPYLPSFPRTMSSRQAECDRQGITATLLDNGASINLVDNVGQTAVMKCVLAGHAVDLKLILDRYSPENNTVNAVDKFGNSALLMAARKEFIGSMRLLISGGADVNFVGPAGMTAYMWCGWTGNIAGMEALLTVECLDTDMQSECGRTALLWAVEKGHSDAVCFLLKYGADANIPLPTTGSSPMLVACRMNYERVVKHLIGGGCRLNDRNKEGLTPLMWAAWQSHDGVVQNLLEHGAIPQLKDRSGRTALDLAKSEETKSMVMDSIMKIGVEERGAK